MIQIEAVKHTIDKELLQKRFRSACKTYNNHAVVQKEMAFELVNIAQKYIQPEQNRMLELGCGTGLLTKEIVRHFSSNEYIANDLVLEVERNIRTIIYRSNVGEFDFIQGDAEKLCLNQKHDVIWSGATLQWIEDLDTFFFRMSQLLTDGGFFALSSFEVDNFNEVKTTTGKGIDYKTLQDVVMRASNHFKVLESNLWHQKIWFTHPKEVLKHIRYTGVNALCAAKWGKTDLERFIIDYQLFKQEKGYPLTYHPFVLVLQKR